MKYDWDISKQRQEDLIDAYKRVAPHCWSQMQAYERTVKEPAPRYYITPRKAAEVVAKMAKGDFGFVNKMGIIKKRMYYSLFEVFMRLSETREFAGENISHIARFAVLEPAPEFFVSPSTMALIRSWMKKGRIDDNGRPMTTPAQRRAHEKLTAKRKAAKEKRLRKFQHK